MVNRPREAPSAASTFCKRSRASLPAKIADHKQALHSSGLFCSHLAIVRYETSIKVIEGEVEVLVRQVRVKKFRMLCLHIVQKRSKADDTACHIVCVQFLQRVCL